MVDPANPVQEFVIRAQAPQSQSMEGTPPPPAAVLQGGAQPLVAQPTQRSTWAKIDAGYLTLNCQRDGILKTAGKAVLWMLTWLPLAIPAIILYVATTVYDRYRGNVVQMPTDDKKAAKK